MKHEWKKYEKELYKAKKIPNFLDVPMQKFIIISGKGNPNDADFSNRISVLYSLAYAVKMNYKKLAAKGELLEDIHDFSVYPLEGVWKQKEDEELIKAKLEYKLMIRQPDFITEDMVKTSLEKIKNKKSDPLFEEIQFDTIEDGLCVEILHVGSFDDEPASFEKINQFLKQTGKECIKNSHREIYLNNAKRTPKNKLQTILRIKVK